MYEREVVKRFVIIVCTSYHMTQYYFKRTACW